MRLVAVAGLLLLLAACGGSGKASPATSTTAPTGTGPPPTATTPLATAPPSSAPATSAAPTPAPTPAGSVTVAVRSPVQFSGTIATAVVCDTERGHYAAEASGFAVGQDTVSMSVNISGYGGPRVYSTPVTVEFLAPDGTSDKVTENIGVKVVDPQHGQFTISGKDDLGKQIDADFNWSCS